MSFNILKFQFLIFSSDFCSSPRSSRLEYNFNNDIIMKYERFGLVIF